MREKLGEVLSGRSDSFIVSDSFDPHYDFSLMLEEEEHVFSAEIDSDNRTYRLHIPSSYGDRSIEDTVLTAVLETDLGLSREVRVGRYKRR